MKEFGANIYDRAKRSSSGSIPIFWSVRQESQTVIVISKDDFNKTSDDVIVVGITSNLLKDKFVVSLTNDDLEEGKLMDACYIKVENILKLDKNPIIKKIGKINNGKFNEIIKILDSILKD